MNSTCDIAVIGGGVIGLACAWRLAQAGAKVHLFERGQIGREASWAAAGMLAAQCEAAVHPPENQPEYSSRTAFFDLCLQSRALYSGFAAELLEATGIDIELSLIGAPTSDWREPGILYVSPGEEDAISDRFLHQRALGQDVEYSQWREKRALWLPQEGQVENRKLVAALKSACEQADVDLHEHQEMKVDSVLGQCDAALLCTGSTPEVEILPNIRPVAGEMLSARPQQRLSKVIYSREVYLVPRRDGRVLIGATMAERGFDKSISAQAKSQLLQSASQLIPEVMNWQIEDHWAGLRPASTDGLPILGRTPVKNLFVATGHFRNGILLTPITAQLMTDCVLKNVSPPEEFSIARFSKGVLASCTSN